MKFPFIGPSCTCGRYTCGGVKASIAFNQQEHVMCFLMGLNESFSQLRAQLLFMEPEPSINRAFSLVAQEAQQRAITASISPTPVALMVKNSSSSSSINSRVNSSNFQPKRKDKPVCSHCGLVGHTVDRCYKLHGYPPGYRSSGSRSNSSTNSSASTRSTNDSAKSAPSSSS